MMMQAHKVTSYPSWALENLWLACEPLLPGLSLELLPEIDSTNSELMRRARAGRRETTLLIAERQTAGRGRLGKVWHSADKETGGKQALTFSLGLPYPIRDFSGLSLAVGCALVEALDPSGSLGLRLKWPNDVWVKLPRINEGQNEGQNAEQASTAWHKLAGILLETVLSANEEAYLVVGVGVNMHTPDIAAQSGVLNPVMNPTLSPTLNPITPTGLQEVHQSAAAIHPGQALHAIAPALIHALNEFSAHGFSAFQNRYAQRDALKGQPIKYGAGDSIKTGLAQGVDLSGALIVQTDHGLELIHSQEVSVRVGKQGA